VSDRPKLLTTEMRMVAAKYIARDIEAQDMLDGWTVDKLAVKIAASASAHMDGYEIAKALESCSGFSCSLETAEILDGFSSIARHQIEEAQKIWVSENDIHPPFPLGTKISCKWGGEIILGVIDEIYKYGPAQYCIKKDGSDFNAGRPIVNFEDVTPSTGPA